MGFRFQKRIRIAPGIRLNLSRSSVSLTGGVPGASVNAGPKGSFVNVGAPGTGLSTRTKLGRRQRGHVAAEGNASGQGVGMTILSWLLALAAVVFIVWLIL